MIKKSATQIANSLNKNSIAALTSQWSDLEIKAIAVERAAFRWMDVEETRLALAIEICYNELEKAKAFLDRV